MATHDSKLHDTLNKKVIATCDSKLVTHDAQLDKTTV